MTELFIKQSITTDDKIVDHVNDILILLKGYNDKLAKRFKRQLSYFTFELAKQ